MNTTNFFVELIVIGSGASLALLMVLIPFIPANRLDALYQFYLNSGNGVILLMLIPIVYLIGILVDRLADYGLKRTERSIKELYFEEDEKLRDARTIVFSSADRLSNLLDYNRSRLRICRGWFLNGIFLLIAFNLFYGLQIQAYKWTYVLFFSSLLILFTYLNFRVWKSLTHKEFEKLKSYSSSILRAKTLGLNTKN